MPTWPGCYRGFCNLLIWLYRGHHKYRKILKPLSGSQTPGLLKSGPAHNSAEFATGVAQSCQRERFDGTGDSFDPIQIGIGVGDRSEELRVLADLVFSSDYQKDILYFIALII